MSDREAPKGAELILKDRETMLGVKGSTVSIVIQCADAYEAQVVYDDFCDRFRSGGSVTIDNAGGYFKRG